VTEDDRKKICNNVDMFFWTFLDMLIQNIHSLRQGIFLSPDLGIFPFFRNNCHNVDMYAV